MLFLPSTNPPGKKSKTGIVASVTPHGNTLRSRPAQIQTKTPNQLLWRQVFQQAKRRWLAYGTGGALNIPTNGIDPQAAWSIQAASYQGIYAAGPIVDGVQGEASMVGSATPEAYQVSVQTTMQQCNLGEAPTPTVTTTVAEIPTYPTAVSASGLTLALIPWGTPLAPPNALPVLLQLTGTASPLPAPPAPSGTGGLALTADYNAIAATPGTTTAITFTLSGYAPTPATHSTAWTDLPDGVTATSATGLVSSLLSPVLNIGANVTPGTYTATYTAQDGANAAAFPVTIVIQPQASFPVQLAFPGMPAALNAPFVGYPFSAALGTSATGFHLLQDSTAGTIVAQAVLLIYATQGTPAGSTSLTLQTTLGAVTLSLTAAIALTTNATEPVLICPSFDIPKALSITTVYDLSYNVTDFQLAYGTFNVLAGPLALYGMAMPTIAIISASPSYTDSYAPPAPTSYLNVIAINPALLSSGDLLNAWQQVFGALPATGNIKFAMNLMDPVTGCPGPTLSSTASWSQGTLRGANPSNWYGPNFGAPALSPWDSLITYPANTVVTYSGDTWQSTATSLNIPPAAGPYWSEFPTVTGGQITAPGSNTNLLLVRGYNGYGGTITFSVEALTASAAYFPSLTHPLPPGVTFTFSPPTITIAPGDPTVYATVLTIAAAAGCQYWNAPIKTKSTDGIYTTAPQSTLWIIGDVVYGPAPTGVGVGMTPATLSVAITTPQILAVTVSSSFPTTLYCVMSAASTNPGLSFAFDTQTLTLPPGTWGTPSTTTCNVTVTTAPGTDTADTFINVTANAGTASATQSAAFI